MHRIRIVAISALLLAAALAPALADSGDHGEHPHHFVRITDGALTPAVVTMKSSDAIAWGNYSAKHARIRFDRNVAKRIVCEDKGSFRLTDTALESDDLRPRQFASMCRMQPGEYSYRVQLRGVTRGLIDSEGMAGTIVVTEE